MQKVRIAIVEDHKILRDGLKILLNDLGNNEIVAEAASAEEFLKMAKGKNIDLLLTDINMPGMGGESLIRIIKEEQPALKVIVLSMYTDTPIFNRLNDLGIDGYIIKESDYEELERAINTVMKNGRYYSQQLLVKLLEQRNKANSDIKFNDREIEILRMLCKGLSTQEIADKLFLSVRTVEKHRSELLVRTESPNSISLVVFAIKNGIVEI